MHAPPRVPSFRLLALTALVCAVLVPSAPAARATTLPAFSVTGTVLFNLGGRQDTAQLGTISLEDPAFGTVVFSSTGTPSPALLASADIGPNDNIPSLFGRGVGVLTYYFEILGPAGSVPVVVDVAGSATASATSGASFLVETFWELFDSPSFTTVLASDDVNSGQITGTFDQGFGRSVDLTLSTNHVYAVVMKADANAAATLEGSRAVANASVDPVFSLGAGVDPGLYSFHFSDGIGNAPVPEPGTLALLGSGLLLLSGVRSGRKQ